MSGRQLKEKVWSMGLSPTQFAAKVGISMPTVYRLFHDKSVAEGTLYKVKRALAYLESTNTKGSQKPHYHQD